MQTIMRLPAVMACTGLSRSTIYSRVSNGTFIKPVSLGGGRAVGWPQNEISIINAARIAGKSDEEVHALVKQLESARKDALDKASKV